MLRLKQFNLIIFSFDISINLTIEPRDTLVFLLKSLIALIYFLALLLWLLLYRIILRVQYLESPFKILLTAFKVSCKRRNLFIFRWNSSLHSGDLIKCSFTLLLCCFKLAHQSAQISLILLLLDTEIFLELVLLFLTSFKARLAFFKVLLMEL